MQSFMSGPILVIGCNFLFWELALRVPTAVIRLTVSAGCTFYRRRGKCRQHNPIQIGGKWMVSVDFLGSGLSELIAVKNGLREWVYLATCKAALSCMH